MSTPLASCLYCEGWGCTYCKPPHVPGEQSPTAEDLEHERRVKAAVAAEREAIRKIVANTAAMSGSMNAGDKEWREACQCIDDLIVARGVTDAGRKEAR